MRDRYYIRWKYDQRYYDTIVRPDLGDEEDEVGNVWMYVEGYMIDLDTGLLWDDGACSDPSSPSPIAHKDAADDLAARMLSQMHEYTDGNAGPVYESVEVLPYDERP